jgi:hypothetical protein
VKRLWNGWSEAGRREVIWDGTNAAGKPQSSGVYLIHLQTMDYRHTAKAILLK